MLQPDHINRLQDVRSNIVSGENPLETAGQLGEVALEIMAQKSSFAIPEVAVFPEPLVPPRIDGPKRYTVEVSTRENTAYPMAFLQAKVHPENSQPVLVSEITLPTSNDLSRREMAAQNSSGLYAADWLGQKTGLTYPLHPMSNDGGYRLSVHRAAGWLLSRAGTVYL